MTDLQEFQRVCRVFVVRLLMVHDEDAPRCYGRMADELEWLDQTVQHGANASCT